MRLQLLLTPILPNLYPAPHACPGPGCGGHCFRLSQEVPKPIRDTVLQRVVARRFVCLRCGHAFRVYPIGVDAGHISPRLRSLAVFLHLVGLSYGASATLLRHLGCPIGKTAVYRAVQKAGPQIAGLRRTMIQGPPRRAQLASLAGQRPGWRCSGPRLVLEIISGRAGVCVQLQILDGAQADRIYAWLRQVAAGIRAEVKPAPETACAAGLPAAGDRSGNTVQPHLLRCTALWHDQMLPLLARDADGSLQAIGVASQQAVADCDALLAMVNQLAPATAAAEAKRQIAAIHTRYVTARTPRQLGQEKATLAYRMRLLSLERWNLFSALATADVPVPLGCPSWPMENRAERGPIGVHVAQSSRASAAAAAGEIRQRLGPSDGALLLFFASSCYEPRAISLAFNAAFPHTPNMGCSTAGEIASGHMSKNSVVAMLLGADLIEDASIQVVDNLSASHGVAGPLQAFERHFGLPVADLDFNQYVGLILVDGLSGIEEKLMDELGDATDVAFVGGSAGDDLKFSTTYVYANGRAYTNAEVLAVLKPKVPFSIIKTQSFTVLPQTLTATRVDQARRLVLAFDGKPAAQAYAEALGVPVEAAGSQFMVHPMGLVAGGEPFVRSPRAIQDGGLAFYCKITEGMQLHLLQSTDIVADTRKAVEDQQAAMGGFSGLINFHCILRTLELEQRGRTDDYGRLFARIPTIGFSTYGEQYLGHINQTSTILAFG